jgi:hypothetical protein
MFLRNSDPPEYQVCAQIERLMQRTLVGSVGCTSREVEHMIVDTIACDLHNNGYALEGNTGANDHEWLAAEIHRHCGHHGGTPFDRLAESDQQFWRGVAAACIAAMPRLMSRIAHRSILYSRAWRSLERALRVKKSGGCPRLKAE